MRGEHPSQRVAVATECGASLATGTTEGLGLTGEAALAQCCAPCVAVSLLLPSLRHGGRAREEWMRAVGAAGAGRTPWWRPAPWAWAPHRSCLQRLPLLGALLLLFGSSSKCAGWGLRGAIPNEAMPPSLESRSLPVLVLGEARICHWHLKAAGASALCSSAAGSSGATASSLASPGLKPLELLAGSLGQEWESSPAQFTSLASGAGMLQGDARSAEGKRSLRSKPITTYLLSED